MQVILEIQTGASKAGVILLQPGQSLQVGRTNRANYSFPQDVHMSGLHFQVECGETQCRIRDLQSRNGTFLNGQRITEAFIGNSDQIVAGQTVFAVRIESEARTKDQSPMLLPEAAREDRLLAKLRGDYQPLFAILDAARDANILKLLIESKEDYQSLYEGPEGQALAHFAPHLVRLQAEAALAEKLARQGWGKSWGVYLTCGIELQDLRQHFRRFLKVKLPDGQQVYFRYYDPRVLRLFLPTCTPEECNLFFGPVSSFAVEGENPDVLLQFSNQGHGAIKTILPLTSIVNPVKPSPIGQGSEGGSTVAKAPGVS